MIVFSILRCIFVCLKLCNRAEWAVTVVAFYEISCLHVDMHWVRVVRNFLRLVELKILLSYMVICKMQISFCGLDTLMSHQMANHC